MNKNTSHSYKFCNEVLNNFYDTDDSDKDVLIEEPLKVFLIEYPGSYMGGRAVVVSSSSKSAYELLKTKGGQLDAYEKCKFTCIPNIPGVYYDWDGEY